MTGPPLPVSRGHAPARRKLSSSDGGHRSGGQGAPQSGGAAKASTVEDGRRTVGRKALQSRGSGWFRSRAGESEQELVALSRRAVRAAAPPAERRADPGGSAPGRLRRVSGRPAP